MSYVFEGFNIIAEESMNELMKEFCEKFNTYKESGDMDLGKEISDLEKVVREQLGEAGPGPAVNKDDYYIAKVYPCKLHEYEGRYQILFMLR